MRKFLWVFAPFVLAGCVTTQPSPLATIPARQIETQKITLGALQSRVQVGVSGDEVIQALGSPNIVTTNDDKTETWVYDKVMTETEVARDATSIAAVRSTRTFLVRIKFDRNKRVQDVSYRQMSY